MRWTLGLVCLATACFGERSESNTTTADDDTTTASTSTMTATTTSATETDPTTTITTTSGDTESSGPPDMTESSSADTTTGDMCEAGMAPNPPPPPRDWIGPVFVSESGAQGGCPEGSEPVATGFDIPPTLDECECVCDEPYEELCSPFFAGGAQCPNGGAINTVIDDPCEVLFDDPVGFTGNASGISCAAEPVMPPVGLIEICGVDAVDGPCIDVLPGFVGPCLFRDGDHDCPGQLVRVDVGSAATCGDCGPCTLGTHCTAAQFQVFATDDCTGGPLVTFGDGMCHEADGAGSIRAIPTTALGCFSTSLTPSELSVCCPPMS